MYLESIDVEGIIYYPPLSSEQLEAIQASDLDFDQDGLSIRLEPNGGTCGIRFDHVEWR